MSATTEPTPLHEDPPYWPGMGARIMSIRVAFDRVQRAPLPHVRPRA